MFSDYKGQIWVWRTASWWQRFRKFLGLGYRELPYRVALPNETGECPACRLFSNTLHVPPGYLRHHPQCPNRPPDLPPQARPWPPPPKPPETP